MRPYTLFYLAAPSYGGWVSYTAHLHTMLRRAGCEASILSVANRSESRFREFCGHAIPYRNVSLADAVALVGTTKALIVAADRASAAEALALAQAGARVVVHDPTELHDAMRPVLQAAPAVVAVCEATLDAISRAAGKPAHLIVHPYEPAPSLPRTLRLAAAWSRLDWDKHTDIIVEANAALAPAKIDLHGAENRLYTHHRLTARWPQWRDSYHGPFERGLWAGVQIAAGAKFAVDLSAIKGDGGGTQYTFLEAWDAGCHLIVNKAWTEAAPRGEVRSGVNATAVGSAADLLQVLAGPPDPQVVQAGQEQLQVHSARALLPKVMELWA